jgi:hypothetical protein
VAYYSSSVGGDGAGSVGWGWCLRKINVTLWRYGAEDRLEFLIVAHIIAIVFHKLKTVVRKQNLN